MSHIHIPDGVLPIWLWGTGWLAALALVGLAGRASSSPETRRRVPLLAVVSALMLVAMSTEIVPIAYHVNLTVVGGALLGPALSPVAAFIVVVVLALLGHGGVTVIGLNTLMISAEMVLGWALFRGFILVMGRARVRPAAAIATVLTLMATTALLVGLVALAGAGPATTRDSGAFDPATFRFANPLTGGVVHVGLFSGGEAQPPPTQTISVKRFATVVFVLGPIGWVLEAAITALVLGYVAQTRPSLLWGLPMPRPQPQGDEAGEPA